MTAEGIRQVKVSEDLGSPTEALEIVVTKLINYCRFRDISHEALLDVFYQIYCSEDKESELAESNLSRLVHDVPTERTVRTEMDVRGALEILCVLIEAKIEDIEKDHKQEADLDNNLQKHSLKFENNNFNSILAPLSPNLQHLLEKKPILCNVNEIFKEFDFKLTPIPNSGHLKEDTLVMKSSQKASKWKDRDKTKKLRRLTRFERALIKICRPPA